jgi:hypothetical protein
MIHGIPALPSIRTASSAPLIATFSIALIQASDILAAARQNAARVARGAL